MRAPHGKLRQPVSDASDGVQRLVGRFLQPSQRIGCKPAPALSFLSWPFFVWPGCKPANPVRTQVRTLLVPNNPANASADATFGPLAHSAGCEPQTLQTLFSGRTVAKCRAVAPRMGYCTGRTRQNLFNGRRFHCLHWRVGSARLVLYIEQVEHHARC